jgi:hypothetical protein
MFRIQNFEMLLTMEIFRTFYNLEFDAATPSSEFVDLFISMICVYKFYKCIGELFLHCK